MTPPPSAGLAQARRLLSSIGALRSAAPTAAGAATTEGAGGAEAEAEAAPMAGISRHGEGLARLPTHPRLGHALLRALSAGGADGAALRVACACAAVLEERDVLAGQ